MAGPTAFSDLDQVLCDLVAGARAILEDGGNFCGAYLQGSFALGGADQHSDVDFLVVVQHEVSPVQETRLRALAVGRVPSKVAALQWARQALDAEWSGLVRHALDSRPDPWSRVHRPADPGTAARTWGFVEYALAVAPTRTVDQPAAANWVR